MVGQKNDRRSICKSSFFAQKNSRKELKRWVVPFALHRMAVWIVLNKARGLSGWLTLQKVKLDPAELQGRHWPKAKSVLCALAGNSRQ